MNDEHALKIAVSGKGGVGKTTLAALLVRHLAAQGRRVIAVDADPVATLGAALAIPGHERILPIAMMTDLVAERTGAPAGTKGSVFKLNPQVDDIPDRFAAIDRNVRLLVMGTVDRGGSGCVCPESEFLKSLVRHLLLRSDDVLVMDMEAGVEHLGRGTAKAVDTLVVVVEPGGRSIAAARQIHRLAADIGLDRTMVVANKVRGAGDERVIRAALADFELVGVLPYDDRLVEWDLAEAPLYPDARLIPPAVQTVLDAIIDRAVVRRRHPADGPSR